jgi:hypothetical protein
VFKNSRCGWPLRPARHLRTRGTKRRSRHVRRSSGAQDPHRALPVEAAFDLFTARVGEWWPTATHSIHEHDVKEVRLEGRVGGQGGW